MIKKKSHSFCGLVRNYGAVLLSGSDCGYLMRLQSKHQLDLHSSEGFTGTGGSVSKVAHSRHWQTGPCCWQEESILPHMGLSKGSLSALTMWWLALPEQLIQEIQAEASTLYELASKVRLRLLRHTPSATQTSGGAAEGGDHEMA